MISGWNQTANQTLFLFTPTCLCFSKQEVRAATLMHIKSGFIWYTWSAQTLLLNASAWAGMLNEMFWSLDQNAPAHNQPHPHNPTTPSAIYPILTCTKCQAWYQITDGTKTNLSSLNRSYFIYLFNLQHSCLPVEVWESTNSQRCLSPSLLRQYCQTSSKVIWNNNTMITIALLPSQCGQRKLQGWILHLIIQKHTSSLGWWCTQEDVQYVPVWEGASGVSLVCFQT